MKRTLWQKYAFLYGVFCILSFIAVSTLTMHLTRTYTIRETADGFYQDASYIASEQPAQTFLKSRGSMADTYAYLQLAAQHQNTIIWLMDSDGTILMDTSKELGASPEVLTDFDPGSLTGTYYQTGDFFGYFSDSVLSVVTPITEDYTINGYVAIHCYLSQVEVQANSLLNISYVTLVVILLLSLILVFGFLFMVYRPLQRLTYAADEYAAGNLNYTFLTETRDELEYLGASLQYLAGQVNKSGEAQRKFISNISHDFRSPLTSIKGYVEAILDGTIPPEMQNRYLNIVLSETLRLNKLTKGLLTLNTFDDKGHLIEKSDFDINAVIRQTLETFEGTCQEKNITFSLTFDEPEQMVYADLDKIQQVLYNLIDNAIKFSHPNSQIFIETVQKHQRVFVSVKDTGIGIPQDSLKKIWERFYKTDLSRGKDKKGTGLGLAITKEIIQAHGEHINVVSTEGVGSEFTFTLQSSN